MLLQNIPLKRHSSFEIGGPASYFCEVKNEEELKETLLKWRETHGKADKIFVLGGGTNVLFSDSGFDGLVIKISISFLERSGGSVIVGAGTSMPELVNFCTQNSLSGIEWAGGLPGTVGGGIRGNAGAFLGDVSKSISEVVSIDTKSLKIIKRSKNECEFGYRQSIFKQGEGRNEIILSAKFKLKKGDSEEIKKTTQEKIDYRIDRHPLDLPNIGSTFKNVDVKKVPKKVLEEFEDKIKPDPFPVLPVAKLLAGAGLKGKVKGGAMISPKHPNFIVNFNNAKAEDVRTLIELAKKQIKEKYDIILEEEILILGS